MGPHQDYRAITGVPMIALLTLAYMGHSQGPTAIGDGGVLTIDDCDGCEPYPWIDPNGTCAGITVVLIGARREVNCQELLGCVPVEEDECNGMFGFWFPDPPGGRIGSLCSPPRVTDDPDFADGGIGYGVQIPPSGESEVGVNCGIIHEEPVIAYSGASCAGAILCVATVGVGCTWCEDSGF